MLFALHGGAEEHDEQRHHNNTLRRGDTVVKNRRYSREHDHQDKIYPHRGFKGFDLYLLFIC